MVGTRTCSFRKEKGESCRATPLRDANFCLWHDPDHTEEVAEARRLGGQRRRRERVVSGVFDFEGLGSIPQVRRLVEVAVLDTLGLENSVARNRTLAYLAQTAAKLLETGELEARLCALEAAVGPRVKVAGGRTR